MGAGLRVVSLHRYPVKSLLGETVGSLPVDARGVTGDRLWAVRTPEGRIGSGKTTRRFAAVPGLLRLRGVVRDGQVLVAFPDGETWPVDDAGTADRLSRELGREVTLARETHVTHFDDGPVSLLGQASVAALADLRGGPVEPARFRPNVVFAGAHALAEDGWVGREVQAGTARLRVTMRSPRCVMVDMASADLPAQPGNLRAVGQLNEACLGVIADVLTPGVIRVGDPVIAG